MNRAEHRGEYETCLDGSLSIMILVSRDSERKPAFRYFDANGNWIQNDGQVYPTALPFSYFDNQGNLRVGKDQIAVRGPLFKGIIKDSK
ncbi:hypothetical protein [uncultured Brevibacillus sp.]|uniref:hypothetical protein n=1 Tax=uncultured Brevibacillus sp. TaxID=169970 RepID=UPI00259267D1|nr:hypothetical protein [uncultured Brevibacillus sp.]